MLVARTKERTTQLYVRRLDQLVATPLVGTEDAGAPFFSPDGQWIGFFADRKLKKVPTVGGAPVILCDAPGARGGTWTAGESIVFAPTNAAALLQVPDRGGAPEPLTTWPTGK
jgi:serine/threonine-protein kinase